LNTQLCELLLQYYFELLPEQSSKHAGFPVLWELVKAQIQKLIKTLWTDRILLRN